MATVSVVTVATSDGEFLLVVLPGQQVCGADENGRLHEFTRPIYLTNHSWSFLLELLNSIVPLSWVISIYDHKCKHIHPVTISVWISCVI